MSQKTINLLTFVNYWILFLRELALLVNLLSLVHACINNSHIFYSLYILYVDVNVFSTLFLWL